MNTTPIRFRSRIVGIVAVAGAITMLTPLAAGACDTGDHDEPTAAVSESVTRHGSDVHLEIAAAAAEAAYHEHHRARDGSVRECARPAPWSLAPCAI